ncbi:putative Colicin import membrane protein [Beijerinckiaceae bacterium RH AL1]|nr:putative Colicin import membrane protein [Beijerinckiaceae bacterium RH AL8]VVB43054.1 putative Colicin import membrane protein [Beijerinckiaceae bacterium RH CH11]VVC53638.1 putative Colicin import membrane protein [Beijerinckiaceae bacterium RH AL1]
MTSAAIRLRAEERWQGSGLSTRRLPATMGLIAIASLVGHLAIVAGAAFDTKPPPPPTEDIAVEIVQEMPKPVEKAPEPAKAEAAKPEAPPKVETAKLEPPRPEPVKPEPAKPEPVKPEPVKAEAPKPAPPPQPSPEDAAKEQKLAELQRELENLKAEQTQLQAERSAAAAAEAQPQPAPIRDTGLGPLPESFQAVALPAAADGQGEATSYQEIVFSALAKAKGIGAVQGLPGTAGVHFTIDAKGAIVDIVLVHKSGVAALDAEALDIVHRAAPFPVPPQGAQRVFDANFTFKTQAAQ